MKLYQAPQLKRWDDFTIRCNFHSSDELIELAAENCVVAIEEEEFFLEAFVFCGVGNNGGDGLAIARLLCEQERVVTTFVVGNLEKATRDFKINMERLVDMDVRVIFLHAERPFNPKEFHFNPQDIVIDALIGYGISRPADGFMAAVIEAMNALPCKIISIDLPSGLQCDLLEPQYTPIVRAHRTLALQVPKRALLMPENAAYIGAMVVLDIALDYAFFKENPCDWNWVTHSYIKSLIKKRHRHIHKYELGHLGIVGGSKGMMGAPVLSTQAALRSGSGVVTAHVPGCGYSIMQTSVAEALCNVDELETSISHFEPSDNVTALLVGPGMGKAPETALYMRKLLKESQLPLVLDADALNLIAMKDLLDQIPTGAILTPHVGEFERLFGKQSNHAQRIDTLQREAVGRSLIIVLKGANTITALPTGEMYFNSTGNPGMATSGSGDVLAGVIGALLAQGYEAGHAAMVGVYMHGMAGDLAAQHIGCQGYLAGDIVRFIPKVWEALY
jgi:ADP-dependent NAD(P)H-hydrate dehydratase / NAD(P)H-hydrate epimerase